MAMSSYGGLPQDEFNREPINLFSRGPRTQAALQKDNTDSCNLCNIFLLTVFIVAVSLAIILPLTLSDRYSSASKANDTSAVVHHLNESSLSELQQDFKDKKDIDDSMVPDQDPIPILEDITTLPNISKDELEELKNFLINNPAIHTSDEGLTDFSDEINEIEVPTSKDSPLEEDHHETKPKDSLSEILNEVFKEEHQKKDNLTRDDFRMWVKKLVARPKMEIAILGTIAVFMGLLLLIISIICLMQRRASKQRILRIKDVVTDLQAPDKVVLLTSDLSDEEC